jgi:carboxyl-terminal processing protease
MLNTLSKILKKTSIGVLLALFLALAVSPAGTARAGFFNHDLDIFEDVLDLIADKYVYPPDFKRMFSAAVKGMAAKVDPDHIFFTIAEDGRLFSNEDQRPLFQSAYNRSGNMDGFKRVYYLLLERFKDKVDKKALEEAAVTAMVDALDPYSQYLDKVAFARSIKDTEGKYGGLGMVITMRDLKLVVVKTMKHSPAERAGVLPDDEITHVSDQPVKGMQIHELAEKLRGYPNTQVKVSIFRPSESREQSWLLTREIIAVETVDYKLLKDGTAHIRVSGFAKLTDDQLVEALTRFKSDHAKALILDLRDNPGGLLEQSVSVAGHFLKDGDLVVYTQGRRTEHRSEYRAETDLSMNNLPLIVLINHYSASASEIVSGSLKDAGKALILGENSYGKGSVQTIFKIRDGAGLRLTTSKYFTPSGIDITAQGIVPDILVVKDQLAEGGKPAPRPKHKGKDSAAAIQPQVRLKESEIEKFLKEKEFGRNGKEDLVLSLAGWILKDSLSTGNPAALEKAREIAANIHY